MRKLLITAALIAAALPLSPAMARQMTGYTVRPTEILSGPDDEYPTVRDLNSGTRLTVFGCLSDWSWCDVSYRYDRGWIAGEDLSISYQGRRSAITPYLGLGILSFAFGTYWDNHYRGRPFYSDRSRWQQSYTQHYRPEWGGRPQGQSGGWQGGNPRRDGQNYQGQNYQDQHYQDRNYRGPDNRGPINREQAAPHGQANPLQSPPARNAPTGTMPQHQPDRQQGQHQGQAAPMTRTAPVRIAPPAGTRNGAGPAPGQQGRDQQGGQQARPQGGGDQRPQGRDNAERKSRD